MWKFGRCNFSHWRVITHRIIKIVVSLGFKMGVKTGFRSHTTNQLFRVKPLKICYLSTFPGNFTQWIVDNVNQNVVLLDGQGSSHGIEIIAVSSPKDVVPLHARTKVIPMLSWITVNGVVKDKGRLLISQYNYG